MITGGIQRADVREGGLPQVVIEQERIRRHAQMMASRSADSKRIRWARVIFAALVDAVKTHSLGQMSHALYDVGGEYRRNM